MLGTKTAYLGLGLAASLGVLALVACGSDSSGGGDNGGAGSSAGGSAGSAGGATTCADCKTPPEKPAAGAQGDGAGQVFAVRSLQLGVDTEWKSIGYDLDGRKSNEASTDHCKLAADTPANIKVDGNNGIDNSFGRNILPQLPVEPAQLTTDVNNSISQGAVTLLLAIDKLGGGTDYVDLPAALYAGAALTDENGTAMAPQWDGTDEWPVFCELLDSCLPSGTPAPPGNKSKVQFANSYVAGGTWVSGAKGTGTIKVALSVAGYSLDLTVHNAVISAKLGSGAPPTSATEGVMAGILSTSEVTATLESMAGKLNSSFCDSESLESFKGQIIGASDIMADGTQDPAKSCDGISIGLGFTLQAVKLGKAMDQQPAGEDPCTADAGR